MSETIEAGHMSGGPSGRGGLPSAVLDGDLRLQTADPAFCRALGLEVSSVAGRTAEELGQGRWDVTSLRPALLALAAGQGDAEALLDLRLEPMLLGVGLAPLWLRAKRVGGAQEVRICLWLPLVDAAPGGASPAALPEAAAADPAAVAARGNALGAPDEASAGAPGGPFPNAPDGALPAAPDGAWGMLGRETYLLQLLMEAVPDVIFVKDRESRFVQANQALARKLGLGAVSEVLGKTDREFFAADLAEAFRQRDELVLVHGQAVINWEQREVWRDGVETWALVTELPLRDSGGQIVGLLGLTRDITERRREQEALQASERMYRSLFERSLCGVFLTTASGRVLDCNQALVRMLGYESRQELLGRPAQELYFHPAERAAYVERLRREGAITNAEERLRRRDGGEVWVLENTSLLRDEHDEELFQGTVTDITERRRLEARLQEGQKMEAVGRLAGGIAHDFNNLLTIIAGQCEMLALEHAPGAAPSERVAAIRAAAQRAAALTRQLLAFGRQLPVTLEALDLNACVRGTCELLRSLAGDDVTLELQLAPRLDGVRADRQEIEQALLHLAGNARAAMPAGGRLAVRTRNEELLAASAGRGHLAPGRYAVLAVGDTGVGIAPEVQARIFEPFFTTHEVGRGSGLGLAGIQGMARLCRGDVRVHSEPGQGSIFEIWLPSRPQPEEVGQGPTVLCVQADANLRALLRDALAGAGYGVLEAAGEAEAMDHCRRHPQPIALLFGELPAGETGWDLGRQARGLRSDIRLLAITAFADRLAAARTASEMGAFLLLKPFTPEAVLERVREILGSAQTVRGQQA